MSSSSKLFKLRARARATVSRAEGLPVDELITDTPGLWLIAHSVGSGSGVTHEQIVEIFVECHGFVKAHSLKQKPYALIEFETEEATEEAFTLLNNKFNATIDKPLILDYWKKVDSVTRNADPSEVPGLVLSKELISEAEEDELIRTLLSLEWIQLNRRKVQHHGYRYRYETNDVDPNDRIGLLPSFAKTLIDRLRSLGLIHDEPDQLTVNQYISGAGIPSHVDTHSIFGEELISISLESAVVMEFRHPNGTICPILLPRRSVIVLRNEARYVWSHGISPRKTDIINGKLVDRGRRISLTFRKIRSGCDCHCKYGLTWQCDSWLSRNDMTRTEQKYVVETYSAIASRLLQAGKKPWPDIAEALKTNITRPGLTVLDVGCGVGRYFDPVRVLGSSYTGLDICPAFIDSLNSRGGNGVVGTQLDLPFSEGSFDLVLSVATLNCLSTEERRLRGLSEISRVLRPRGAAIIAVKGLTHRRKKYKQQDIFKQLRFDGKDSESSQVSPDFEAVESNQVDRDSGLNNAQIFYHLYKEGELGSTMISSMKVISSRILESNNSWTIVCTKRDKV